MENAQKFVVQGVRQHITVTSLKGKDLGALRNASSRRSEVMTLLCQVMYWSVVSSCM